MDFIRSQFISNFDTLVLLLAFAASIVLVLHIVHHDASSQALVSWAQGIASGFGGALLLRLNRRTESATGGTNGKPSPSPLSPNPNPQGVA